MSLKYLKRQIRARQLCLDRLELRCLFAGDLQIDLWPELDQFGGQIEVVMGYKLPGETDEQARIAFALYDTGASVITYAASDQQLFELTTSAIPIKVPGGATADAIGGELVGDVSMPGEIIADGMHAMNFTGDVLEMGIDFTQGAARTLGVQAFMGNATGSASLPTITGTVIHNPSPTHPGGTAALIDMTAFKLDFGELFPEFPEFAGIVLDAPDLRFVEPGTKLTAATDGTISEVVRIPLDLWGENNHAAPGDSITTTQNPVQTGTSVSFNGITTTNHTMLFDTGAQLSVISTDMALALGLDLDAPLTSITVQGAAGQVTVPGFTIDSLQLPRDDNGDGTIDGTLTFIDVPIYVLDVVPGLDGILGMNLFNLAKDMLYDPHDPAGASLQVSFFTNLERTLPDEIDLGALDLISQSLPALSGSFGGQSLPGFGIEVPVPNQPPTNITLSRSNVFAATPGAWVGYMGTSDADIANTHTYTFNDPRFEVRAGSLYLKPTAVVSPGEAPISLQVTSTDSGTPALSVTRSFTLTVSAAPAAWDYAFQWKPLPADIDVDGKVTPFDALQIINELNFRGVRTMPVMTGGTASGPFFDVSGDGAINPLDALLVINYLNASGAAEGEAATVAPAVMQASFTDAAITSLVGGDDEAAALEIAPVTTSAALPPLDWFWSTVMSEDASARSKRSATLNRP